MPLDDFYKKIVVLQEFDIAAETAIIINQNSEYIAGLLKTQLSEGKSGDGTNVTIFGRDYYKDATIFNKEHSGTGLGKVTDVITNYMSGAFYMSIKVIAEEGGFLFDSDVDYFDDIIQRSGSKIMELNAENCLKFSQEILFPQLQEIFSLRFNA